MNEIYINVQIRATEIGEATVDACRCNRPATPRSHINTRDSPDAQRERARVAYMIIIAGVWNIYRQMKARHMKGEIYVIRRERRPTMLRAAKREIQVRRSKYWLKPIQCQRVLTIEVQREESLEQMVVNTLNQEQNYMRSDLPPVESQPPQRARSTPDPTIKTVRALLHQFCIMSQISMKDAPDDTTSSTTETCPHPSS